MQQRGPRSHTELTLRGLFLGAAITVAFTAANIYMGLKTGMTFSSSIPAAIISMAVIRLLSGGGILENNIVQTQASAAGTLCNVILVLPGLVMIGHWQGFPFFPTMAICLFGGLLGVMYSIPLRRALVMEGDLPFPEGQAAAEVLQSGSGSPQAKSGLRDLAKGGAAAAAVSLCTNGFRVLGDSISVLLTGGHAVFRFSVGFSLAMLGVGYLVGIGACAALLLGVCIAWGVAVPILTGLDPTTLAGAAGYAANVAWTGHVRLIGAGIIAVGGAWTVVRLFAPMVASIRHALAIALIGRHRSRLPRQERDIPMTWVGAAAAILTLPLGALVAWFVVPDLFAPSSPVGVTDHIGLRLAITLLVGVTFFVVVFGFLMATACGYMAGLLGSSSSPISGVGILTVILVSLILRGLSGVGGQPAGWVVAVALFVTSLIVTIASIANDNLQDLKTGQLVDATPWQQQVALMIGVAVGAAVTPPLLDLLVNTYGIAGAPLRPEMDAAKVLAAPQASLIAEIARGIVGGHLPWNMVVTGIALGMPLIGLEELLRHRGRQFPVLTVGIGLYLPPTVSLTIALGGVVGWLAHRTIQRQARSTGDSDQRVQEHRRRRGVLLASGFLVGESFVGVLLAGVGALTGADTLKLVPPNFAGVATWLGLVIFTVAVVLFYRAVSRPPATAIELMPATNEG